MSEVSGDFPSRKERRPSLHVFDATDASSSATVKDAQFFDVSASPSSAPTSGTDGKTYRVYKTVFDPRDAADKNVSV